MTTISLPAVGNDQINEISSRYIELYEKVTGKSFVKGNYNTIQHDVETAENKVLETL